MRFLRVAVVGLLLLVAAGGSAAEGSILTTKKDKVSYAMAVAVTRSLQRQGVEIDVHVFAQGMADALARGKLLLTEAEMRQAMNEVVVELKKKQKAPEATPASAATTKKTK